MTFAFQLRTWHKWLGLALGAQMLVWCVSGLYMASIDIDYIRGAPLVREHMPRLSRDLPLAPLTPILAQYEQITSIKLAVLPDDDQAVYELSTTDRRITIDAATGAVLSPLPQARIESLARTYYAGDGAIASVQLIDEAPVEVRGRTMPLWRVDFDDRLHTSFYLDPNTGALATKRHRLWRVFDAFWMLHIMDYGYERDDMNNLLLRLASAAGVLFGATGLWLLVYSFRRRRRVDA